MRDFSLNKNMLHGEVQLSILGMRCAGCVSAIEGALANLNGVTFVSVNFADHSALVRGLVDTDSLIQTVKDAGFDAAVMEGFEDPELEEQLEINRYRKLIKKAVVAGGFGHGKNNQCARSGSEKLF